MMTTSAAAPLTIGGALEFGQKVLFQGEVPEAKVCAEILLGHVLGQRATYLRISSDTSISESQFLVFNSLLERRLTHEPIQYILGDQEFFGRTFKVGPGVLIPRPETELLVEKTLDVLKFVPSPRKKILEIGTGSGCVAITLALENENADVVAVDISQDALHIAQSNAAKHNVLQRCQMVLGETFGGQQKNLPFDVIVSNPPYIPTQTISGLEAQVKNFEPHLALDGGGDGLGVIRTLIEQAPIFLQESGFLLFEFGEDQVQAICRLVEGSKYWEDVEIFPDLNHRPRVFRVKKWMQ